MVFQCALEHDLTLFDAGDATEVGEKGLTLSGGKHGYLIPRARISYNSNRSKSSLDVSTGDLFSELCCS